MNLPDALLEQARSRARAERRSVTSLVEQALRELLTRPPGVTAPLEPLPTFGTPGGGVLIDLDDKSAVWAALDADGYR